MFAVNALPTLTSNSLPEDEAARVAQSMTREERLEAMSEADAADLVRLADSVLADLDVEVTRGPSVGLLMIRVEDPSERLPFNFTEVTVSEAEVLAEGHRGYAMVMGTSPEHALAAAVLDVAVEAGHHLAPLVVERLEVARRTAEARWAARWSEVAPTHVQFEDVT